MKPSLGFEEGFEGDLKTTHECGKCKSRFRDDPPSETVILAWEAMLPRGGGL